MRRIIVLLAVTALAIAAVAAPAAADRPTEYVTESTMLDVDPCTGEDMTVYAVFAGRAHEHNNITVLTIDSSATTSNGYIGNGRETTLISEDKYISNFNWVTVNPDTDARILVKGRFHIDFRKGEVKWAGVELRCVGRAA